MNTHELVQYLSKELSDIGHDNPKRTIEELISYHLKCKPLEIYNYPTPKKQIFDSSIKRLLNHEPLQYIIGKVEFYDLTFKCDNRALIPRPETELLIELVIKSNVWVKENPKIIDIGTGSGCIAITLSHLKYQALIEAVDISEPALKLASENAKNHKLENIKFYKSDLLNECLSKKYDIIISNPPYIPTSEWKNLKESVKNYEPRNALDAGISGLKHIENISQHAYQKLSNDGMLFFEIGYNQASNVSEILIRNGFKNIQFFKDYQKIDRMVVANK